MIEATLGLAVQLTEGMIVHYVMPNGRYPGEHRPAMVVRIWPGAHSVQLNVFVDFENDGYSTSPIWATSVVEDSSGQKPGTWHWPELPAIPDMAHAEGAQSLEEPR